MIRFLLVGFACLAAVVPAQAQDKVVEEVKAIFEKAESVVVFSLNPDPKGKEVKEVKDGYHGWEVLKRVEVKPGDRKEVLAALVKSIESKASGAKCFEPGHGVSVTAGKTRVDFVICFKCDWVHIHVAGAERPIIHTIGGEAHAVLDRMLNAK